MRTGRGSGPRRRPTGRHRTVARHQRRPRLTESRRPRTDAARSERQRQAERLAAVWLTVGSGAGKGVSVRVDGPRFIVGTGPESQLMLGDPKASPLHAYFEFDDDVGVMLHDLGSDA